MTVVITLLCLINQLYWGYFNDSCYFVDKIISRIVFVLVSVLKGVISNILVDITISENVGGLVDFAIAFAKSMFVWIVILFDYIVCQVAEFFNHTRCLTKCCVIRLFGELL